MRKKERILQRTSSKQARAYLERNPKRFQKKSSYISMRPVSRRRCIASIRVENEWIFALAAKAMLELGLLRHNVKERCLLRTLTAERRRLLYSNTGLKTNCWADYRKGTSSSWTMQRFIKKRACRILRENTRRNWFFCRRIHRSTILLISRRALWSGKLLTVFRYMAPLQML